jgi:hypothetical protein
MGREIESGQCIGRVEVFLSKQKPKCLFLNVPGGEYKD